MRTNETSVHVEIRIRDDVFSNGWADQEHHQARFQASPALVEFADAVAAGARRCAAEFGLDGYAEQWRDHPFPRLQLEALQGWIAAGGEAPLYEPY